MNLCICFKSNPFKLCQVHQERRGQEGVGAGALLARAHSAEADAPLLLAEVHRAPDQDASHQPGQLHLNLHLNFVYLNLGYFFKN